MYQIERKIGYILGTLLQLFYIYLGYKINLSYEYKDGFEFLVGIFVTTVIMNLLDWGAYLIAYSAVGRLSIHDSAEMKVMHWIIRIGLYGILYLISITPLCSIIITPIVKDCTRIVMEWIEGTTNEMSNGILNIVTKQ